MDPPLDEVIHSDEHLNEKGTTLEASMAKMNAKLESNSQTNLNMPLENNPSNVADKGLGSQIKDKENPSSSSSAVVSGSGTQKLSQDDPMEEEVEAHSINNVNVLKRVFAKLDLQSLKNVRLVSKAWKKLANPHLSKITQLNLLKWNSSCSTTSTTSLFNILYNIIVQAPPDLFTNVSVKGCSLEGPEGEPGECQLLFREFGSRFISLSLHRPSFSNIQTMLVENCPNLEELNIIYGGDYCETEQDTRDFTLHSSNTLKLKSLKVDVQYTDDDFLLVQTIAAFPFITIAKLSPDLTTLALNHPKLCHNFFAGVQKSADVTKKITDLEIHGGFDEDYNSLQNLLIADIDFGDQLRVLTVRQNNPLLAQFLNKVGPSLKRLNLGGPLSLYFMNDFDLDIKNMRILPSSELSPLESIKIFTFELYCSIPSSNRIGSLDFLKAMTYLETISLKMGCAALDCAFLKSKELQGNPAKAVKTLSIVGTIQNVISFHIIREMFPSLENLTLVLNTGGDERDDDIEGQKWYEEVVGMISHLTSLKELHLDFNWSDCKNFEGVFKHLKNLTNLSYLEIALSGNSKWKEAPRGLEKAIVDIPNLKRLKLFNFSMQLSEAKKFFDSIAETEIQLEITEDKVPCGICAGGIVHYDDDDDDDTDDDSIVW